MVHVVRVTDVAARPFPLDADPRYQILVAQAVRHSRRTLGDKFSFFSRLVPRSRHLIRKVSDQLIGRDHGLDVRD
jgi:hypothetical protein